MLGRNGIKNATIYSVLNANYVLHKLSDYYKILYTSKERMCAHEFIMDMR